MTPFADRTDADSGAPGSRVETVERLREILDSASDAFVGMDAAGVVIDWNRQAETLFGWSRADAIGRSVADLIVPAEFRDAHSAGVQRYLRTRRGRVLGLPVETRAMRKDGSEVPIELTRWAVSEADTTVFHAFIRDISARKQAEYEATHDQLTGAANRSLLVRELDVALGDMPHHGYRPALLLVDIARFRRVNQDIGPSAADAVLQQVAGRLRESVHDDSLVARMSGDRFGVLLTRAATLYDVRRIAHRLFDRMHEPITTGAGGVTIRVCIGGAIAHDAPDWVVDSLFSDADAALADVKRSAGGGVSIFDGTMRVRLSARKKRQHELALALEQGQLELHYQPVFALPARRVNGAEALLRWHHPEHGLLGPGEFIDIAETSGLIEPIGRWVLEQACVQLKSWQDVPDRATFQVAVNVSARQLRHPRLVDDIVAAAHAAGIDLARGGLVVEVTESAFIENPDTAADMLRALRRRGVQVAVDDFGTGYASLLSLREIPADILKIDKSFVDGLPGSRVDTAIVRSTIALADDLALDVVAEGVETAEQLETLADFGCGFIQGFLLAKPEPADVVTAMLRVE